MFLCLFQHYKNISIMKNLKVKDLVYSTKNNKVGFIILIRTEDDGITYYDIQHPYEYSEELTEKQNNHQRLLETSVHLEKDLLKISIGE